MCLLGYLYIIDRTSGDNPLNQIVELIIELILIIIQ